MPPAHARRDWTWPQGLLAGVLVLACLALIIAAFTELFITSTTVVAPWFGGRSWIVPVCGEAAWLIIWGSGVLLAARKVTGSAMRHAYLAVLVTGSVILQVYAGHGILPSIAGHVLVVAAFYCSLAAAKSAVLRIIRGDIPPDRLTAGEWATHPSQSFALWRRMMAWGERSKAVARIRYAAELYAVALAQADLRIGRGLGWRRRLPVTLRFQVTAGIWPPDIHAAITAPGAAAGAWQGPLSLHVSQQLSLLDSRHQDGTADTAPGDSPRDTAAAATGSTRRATARDTGDSTGLPSARGIPRADLLRRTKAALRRWEEKHPGERLPDAQLPALLGLRMSRETAKGLLAEVRAGQDPVPRLAPVRKLS